MSLDKTSLKSAMIRDKGFIKELFIGNSVSNAKLLNFAEDVQLNTLIKILYFVANGEIKVKKSFSDNVKQIKLLRKHFESKQAAMNLIKNSRVAKIKALKVFSSHFNLLLYHILNK